MSKKPEMIAVIKNTVPLILALVLSACAGSGNKLMSSSHEIVDAAQSTYEVECSGAFGSAQQCHERAKEICKEKEVVWTAAVKPVPVGNAAEKSGSARLMQFRCGRKEVVAAPAPKPAPAPPPPRAEKITLASTQLFGFDSSVLRLPQPKLDEIASALIANQQVSNVVITGYTDRLGSEKYNQPLSQQRAEAVKRYLVSRGVAAARVTSIGKGSSNPVIQCSEKNHTELIRCLEPNRRVEVEQFVVEKKEGRP